MPLSIPLSLIFAWAMLFAFMCAQYHHEEIMKRSPYMWEPTLFKATQVSSLLSLLTAISILIYYFIKTKWYWVIALSFGGSMLGALAAGILFSSMGEAVLSRRAFYGWPIMAVWSISIIHGLRT